jgi:hypothetical protein
MSKNIPPNHLPRVATNNKQTEQTGISLPHLQSSAKIRWVRDETSLSGGEDGPHKHNAMPLHYMQAFMLPRWVFQPLNKINRRFLWRGKAEKYSGGHCLVPWERVTLPKRFEGLRITDLQLQNKALLLKWLWSANNNETSLWSRGATGRVPTPIQLSPLIKS